MFNDFATSIGDAARRHPVLTKALAIGAATFAGLFLVLGGGAIVIAGLIAPFAALSFAAGALGIGLLPVIGIALAVVASVTAIGAVAYYTYKNGLGGLIAALVNFSPVGLLWRGISGMLSMLGITVPARLTDAGRWMIQGLMNRVTEKLAALKALVIGAGTNIANWFRRTLGIHSPSRVFADFGGNIVDGLTVGIAAQESEPVKRMDSLSRRLTAAIVTGSALPAMAMAAPAAGGVGGRGATPIAAGLPSITIQIYGAPGQSEQAIAEMVARKLRELGIVAPGTGSPSFGDRPDWE